MGNAKTKRIGFILFCPTVFIRSHIACDITFALRVEKSGNSLISQALFLKSCVYQPIFFVRFRGIVPLLI